MSVPSVTTAQMVEVDRLMIEEYGITLVRMMENAGRNLARLAVDRFHGEAKSGVLSGVLSEVLSEVEGRKRGSKSVLVMAGTGGNGGGAMVCARRLSAWGWNVTVILAKEPDEYTGVPGQQLAILRRMNVNILPVAQLRHVAPPGLIIDGLVGYSLSGAPRAGVAECISWANRSGAPVLALDVPSGLDAATGKPYDPAVRATATLTLGLPKTGLFAPTAKDYVGELYLGDISIPPEVYDRIGLEGDFAAMFADGEVVRIA